MAAAEQQRCQEPARGWQQAADARPHAPSAEQASREYPEPEADCRQWNGAGGVLKRADQAFHRAQHEQHEVCAGHDDRPVAEPPLPAIPATQKRAIEIVATAPSAAPAIASTVRSVAATCDPGGA